MSLEPAEPTRCSPLHTLTHVLVLPPGRQVLKVAILAEKYAVDYSWYVDTILNLIRIAGDYVSEEVWYRVLQIVTNRDDVQGYAAKTVFEVSAPGSPHQGASRQSKDNWAWGTSRPGRHPASPSQSSALGSPFPKGHGGGTLLAPVRVSPACAHRPLGPGSLPLPLPRKGVSFCPVLLPV